MTERQKYTFANTNYQGIFPVASESDHDRLRFIPALAAAETIEADNIVDKLTGCFNQNFLLKYQQDIFDPGRDRLRVGLIFVDINDLKTVNDTQGHSSGDKLIVKTADTLKASTRKGDIVVRLGGDEFVVIYHAKQGKLITDKKLKERADKRFADAPVSFAYGCAVFSGDDKNLDDTLRRADSSMYQHKSASRK